MILSGNQGQKKQKEAKSYNWQKLEILKTSGAKVREPHSYNPKPLTTANHKNFKGKKSRSAVIVEEKGTIGLQFKARFENSLEPFKNKWYLSE